MATQVLHVANQGQSMQKRVKEGMRGQLVAWPVASSPLVPVGVMCETHHSRHPLCSMKSWGYMSTTNKSTSWLWTMSL